MKNLAGREFGSWLVLRKDPEQRYRWICLCACGNERSIFQYSLLGGGTKSCGNMGGIGPHLKEGINQVLCFVANETGHSQEDMIGPGRPQPLAQMRQLAMWLVRKELRASLMAIGTVFGDRDHTTVLHAVRVTNQRIKHDPAWRDLARNLRTKLKGQAWLPRARLAA